MCNTTVTIDYEDREQVERLRKMLADSGAITGYVKGNFDLIQAALRKFANPTPPKLDEPQGLGAVVEDAEGERWMLTNPRGVAKWSPENAGADGKTSYFRTWQQTRAVRILSEGMTS